MKAEPGINKMAIKEMERVMENHDFLPSFMTLDEMKSSTRNIQGYSCLRVKALKFSLLHGLELCFRFSNLSLNIFQRNLGRFSQNPDVIEVAYGVQHMTQRKIIKKIKGGCTTYGCKNAWTKVCNQPVV